MVKTDPEKIRDDNYTHEDDVLAYYFCMILHWIDLLLNEVHFDHPDSQELETEYGWASIYKMFEWDSEVDLQEVLDYYNEERYTPKLNLIIKDKEVWYNER